MRRLTALATVAALFAGPALAAEMPARKAGLWEMNMVFDGIPMPPQTMRQCIDQATDKALQAQYGAGGTQGATCSKQDFKTAGSTSTFESVCKVGPATTTTKGTITGSFDSAYKMQISTNAVGGETKMTIEAKYLGACQAGQKPGDIVMSNGMKMNVLDMQKMGAGMMPSQ